MRVVIRRKRRASKGVSTDLLIDERINAVSTLAFFLANATNKSQLIAVILSKCQHHGMSFRCLKIMEFLLKLYGLRIVQTRDKHRYTCYHRSIRRFSLSYSFQLEFLQPTRTAAR